MGSSVALPKTLHGICVSLEERAAGWHDVAEVKPVWPVQSFGRAAGWLA